MFNTGSNYFFFSNFVILDFYITFILGTLLLGQSESLYHAIKDKSRPVGGSNITKLFWYAI